MARFEFNFDDLSSDLKNMLGRGGDTKKTGGRGQHPEECLTLDDFVAEAIKTGFKLKDVYRDEDGDIPIGYGSTVVFVRPHEEDSPYLYVWALLLREFDLSPAVYEAINAINNEIPFARVVLNEDPRLITLEAWLLVDSLSRDEVMFAVEFVGDAADHFDTLLQQRFGGYLADEDDDDDGTVEF